MDELVYQIIGSESPVLDGINVTESLITPEAVPPETPDNQTPETEEGRKSDEQELHKPSLSRQNNENMPPTPIITRKFVKGKGTHILRRNNSTNIQKEKTLLSSLKEEKLKLTIVYLKLKMEKTKKEIALLDKAASKQTNKGRVASSQVMETDEPIVADEECNTIRADEPMVDKEYYKIETDEPAVNNEYNMIETDKPHVDEECNAAESDDDLVVKVEYIKEDEEELKT